MSTDRVIARVLHLKRDRAFGFVSLPDGREPFFHRTDCVPPGLYDELEEKETLVTGDLQEREKGPRLTHVTLASAEEREAFVDVIVDGNR